MVLPPVRKPRFRLAVAGLIGAAFLMLGGGTAIAMSSSAIPGDPLYGVKRAIERISLAMHRDPVSRANLHLQFANNRLQEVAALTLAGKNPEALADDLEAELDAAEHDALQAQGLGKDAEAILAHVQAMISKHVTVLTNVLDKVPDQAKDAIQHAIDNAEKAQAKVQHGRQNGNSGKKPSSSPGRQRSSPGRP
jgi:ABC-type transporter Mla subunit MlaD